MHNEQQLLSIKSANNDLMNVRYIAGVVETLKFEGGFYCLILGNTYIHTKGAMQKGVSALA